MIKPNAIAVVAAMYGPSIVSDKQVQHAAKPNAPPVYTKRIDCNYRDLETGVMPRFCNNYSIRRYCHRIS